MRRIWGSCSKKYGCEYLTHTQTRLVPLVTNVVHGNCLKTAILYFTEKESKKMTTKCRLIVSVTECWPGGEHIFKLRATALYIFFMMGNWDQRVSWGFWSKSFRSASFSLFQSSVNNFVILSPFKSRNDLFSVIKENYQIIGFHFDIKTHCAYLRKQNHHHTFLR